jgi:hypothetical protein
MKTIVNAAGEVLAKTSDDGVLIGGQHRIRVVASAGEECFWQETGKQVKLDASFFKQLAGLARHSP